MTRKKIFFLAAVLLILATLLACGRLTRWGKVHRPPDDTCAHCHSAIYRDWKIAYRPYNEAAKGEDYTPVHSQPMSAADVRMQRSHTEGKGECSECHIVKHEKELLSISKLGASFRDTVYQICGRCHEKTFNEWGASKYVQKEVSCLICHTDTRDKPIKEKARYYHTTKGVEGFDPKTMSPSLMLERLRNALYVGEDVWVKEGRVSVLLLVRNDGVGHNIPTDAINARLVISLKLLDAGGAVVDAAERIVDGKEKNSIPADGEIYLDFEMVPQKRGQYTLHISLDHRDREREGAGEAVNIVNKRVDITIE